ncbi:hypothetical protein AMTRI_Chr06g169660 [Amborella trichopoda]
MPCNICLHSSNATSPFGSKWFIKPLSKERKNGLILTRKIIYYKRKKIIFSFCLSKISSTISSCLFKSCPRFLSLSKISKIRSAISSCLSKSCPSSGFLFLYKIVIPKFVPSCNEDQWFLCPSPLLSFYNTLYERAGDHNVLVHKNIIGIIVKPPSYFMVENYNTNYTYIYLIFLLRIF